MHRLKSDISVTFGNTQGICPVGETTAITMITQGRIPVVSCEGSCIRGEIARLAANMLAKEPEFGRGCHGEFFTVPHSAMAKWANQADKIVVIDGCFLHCHGRIMEGLFDKNQLAVFDALSFYGKYTDIMDIDGVPESERQETATTVYNKVREAMSNGTTSTCGSQTDRSPNSCRRAPAFNSGCSS